MKKLLVALLIAMAFTGVAFAEGQQEGAAGVVTLWHAYTGTEAEVLESAVDAFNSANEDVTVEVLSVSNDDLLNKYETAAASGSGPEIILTSASDRIGQLADSQLIAPIDSLGIDTSKYLPSAIDGVTYEGSLYGVPLNIKSVALFYNKTMVDEPAKTLDELVAHAADGKAVTVNNSFYHGFWGVQAFGGQLFDDNRHATLDDGGFAGWLEWLKDNQNKPGMTIDPDYGKLNSLFREGQAAYYVDGPWALGDMQKALGTENVGIAPLPAGPKGPSGPFLGTECILFNAVASDEALALAARYAEYHASAQVQKMFADAGHIVANVEVDNSGNPAAAGFIEQAKTAVAMPNIPEMGAVWTPGGDAYVKVSGDLITGEEAAAEAANLINEANGR